MRQRRIEGEEQGSEGQGWGVLGTGKKGSETGRRGLGEGRERQREREKERKRKGKKGKGNERKREKKERKTDEEPN